MIVAGLGGGGQSLGLIGGGGIFGEDEGGVARKGSRGEGAEGITWRE